MPFLYRVVLASVSALLLTASALGAGNSKNPRSGGSLSAQVTSTNNPQVAQYVITAPQPGTWFVSFGPTTAYGRTTSVQPIAVAGKPSSVYVAGMLPQTTYHMQASVTLSDGSTLIDQDRTFTTGPLPTGFPFVIPVTLGATGTPQPGVELINPLLPSLLPSGLVATDLQGNVIWTYTTGHAHEGPDVYPAKMLANGDLLVYIAPNSYPVDGWGSNDLREIDLAGNTVRDLKLQQLNAQLSHIGFAQKLETYTHDFALMPNGHTLVIANEVRTYTNLVGYPGTTDVVGDVVIDLDDNWNPVWFWDTFDHLDVNRHPFSGTFPDWTHANSIAYSADDGNFILSMRHQSWIIKVDYRNGRGTGNILWRLGEGGDIALRGAVDPDDWFYAQHDAEFVGLRSAGVFTLSIMDNGISRLFANGCGGPSQAPCNYSTIDLLQVDENAKTATYQVRQVLPFYLFSSWGGSVDVLANGDIEYDLTSPSVGGGSEIYEVTNQSTPQTVWSQVTPGSNAYRAVRLPSLYPGVQW